MMASLSLNQSLGRAGEVKEGEMVCIEITIQEAKSAFAMTCMETGETSGRGLWSVVKDLPLIGTEAPYVF